MKIFSLILLVSLFFQNCIFAACNCTTRRLDASAGVTYSGDPVQCAAISATILGQTVEIGATTCYPSKTVRTDDLFRCEGALAGYSCNPNGNQAGVWVYDNGGCRVLSDYESMKDLKDLARCKPGTKVPDQDGYSNSATVSAC